ncbi:hypothetical protein SDC9_115960 [bioreactor metagenome]|uniref:Uncharacterized protein n=1 Tax=bioreactor metagenome TaxID=1076179 RepID=A0A645BUD3_9ZZZZ
MGAGSQVGNAEGTGDRKVVQCPCLDDLSGVLDVEQHIKRCCIADVQGIGEIVDQKALILSFGDGGHHPCLEVLVLEVEASSQEMVGKQGCYTGVNQGVEVQGGVGGKIAVCDYQCIQIGGPVVDDRETEAHQRIELDGGRASVYLCECPDCYAQRILSRCGELKQGGTELVSSCKQLSQVQVIDGSGEAQAPQLDLILHNQLLTLTKDRS